MLRIVICSLFTDTRKKKHKRPITITKKVYISPTLGDAFLEPIATQFGNSLYLTEFINRSKFGVDWLSSFGSGEVQNVMFPIGTTSDPYHCGATALARDLAVCVIEYMILIISVLAVCKSAGSV